MKQIAKTLHISLSTVNTHLYNIYNELGAHSKLDAVRIALINKFITIDNLKEDDKV